MATMVLSRQSSLTLTIEAANIQAARSRLGRIEADTMNQFKVMGAAARVLNGKERLSILHGIFHPDGNVLPLNGIGRRQAGCRSRILLPPLPFTLEQIEPFAWVRSWVLYHSCKFWHLNSMTECLLTSWRQTVESWLISIWKASQDEIKGFLGEEYQDYNLVLALPNGRPCDERLIHKAFAELKEQAELPNVVFHSLRHSSTTYKLKLNHGDLKATQGDTGHAEIDMITKVYAHILDDDRKVNAQKFETAFYSNPDLRNVKAPQETSPALDINTLIEQLQKSPELINTLAALITQNNQISK